MYIILYCIISYNILLYITCMCACVKIYVFIGGRERAIYIYIYTYYTHWFSPMLEHVVKGFCFRPFISSVALSFLPLFHPSHWLITFSILFWLTHGHMLDGCRLSWGWCRCSGMMQKRYCRRCSTIPRERLAVIATALRHCFCRHSSC